MSNFSTKIQRPREWVDITHPSGAVERAALSGVPRRQIRQVVWNGIRAENSVPAEFHVTGKRSVLSKPVLNSTANLVAPVAPRLNTILSETETGEIYN